LIGPIAKIIIVVVQVFIINGIKIRILKMKKSRRDKMMDVF